MPKVSANGIEITYDEFGDRSGRPLLLIMGLGGQMIMWREEMCEMFAQRGHRVVRFDNRDVGQSTSFEHLGVPDVMSVMMKALTRQPITEAPYLLKDMAADAAGLLEALEIESAHVVGASMGGMIAQQLAIDHPQRVRTLTSIMSTTGNPDLPQPRGEATGALLAPMPNNREESIQRGVNIFRTIGSPGFEFDEAEVRAVAERSYDRGFNPTGVVRQLVAILASGSRKEALAKLEVPALVIHGKDDPLVPVEGGLDTAEAIRGAKLMLIEGMGHDMPKALRPRIVEAISELTASA